jgi:hypothetical protein
MKCSECKAKNYHKVEKACTLPKAKRWALDIPSHTEEDFECKFSVEPDFVLPVKALPKKFTTSVETRIKRGKVKNAEEVAEFDLWLKYKYY